MKNLILLFCITITVQQTYAQTQIENGGFEQWENIGYDTEEPLQWSSLKTSTDNSILNLANQAPQVVWQSTNAPHSGSSCLYLKVASYNVLAGLSPNAIATNGRVFASTTPANAYVYTETSDTKWNTICGDKPDSLVGWYKYAPQSNDKGKVEVLFHTSSVEGKLPENGSTSHWVGTGLTEFTSVKSTWTRFSMPINYTSNSAPNYFLIVTTAGDELNAVSGSELWVDDFSFIYNPAPVSVESNQTIDFKFYAANQKVVFDSNLTDKQISINLLSMDGKTVWSKNNVDAFNEFTPNLDTGIYIYTISIDGKTYSGKIVL